MQARARIHRSAVDWLLALRFVRPHPFPMRLVSPDGDELELSIVGYQFPDADDPRQRFSWNVVEGDAVHGHERWHFRWPALACDEPPLLVRWLRAVAAWAEAGPGGGAGPAPTALGFTEPNLSFEVLDRRGATEVALRVGLDLEFRPPGVIGPRAGDPTFLTMRLRPGDLRRAAQELEVDIARYPDGLAGR